jgi:hypothetical protein
MVTDQVSVPPEAWAAWAAAWDAMLAASQAAANQLIGS